MLVKALAVIRCEEGQSPVPDAEPRHFRKKPAQRPVSVRDLSVIQRDDPGDFSGGIIPVPVAVYVQTVERFIR